MALGNLKWWGLATVGAGGAIAASTSAGRSFFSSLPGTALGFGEGLVNEANSSLPINPGNRGDIWEPRGANQTRGYDAAKDVLYFLHIEHRRSTTWKDPNDGTQLATTQITTAADSGPVVATFSAQGDPSNTWTDTSKASEVVGVYVDGKYQSSVAVITEDNQPYKVNLGVLPAGAHTIELRTQPDISPSKAKPPTVSGMSATIETGEQAVIDENEPIVENRDLGTHRGTPELGWNDTPVAMETKVTKHSDGSQTIDYNELWSEEDGGTPWQDLFGSYGRTTDYEKIFSVDLDASGKVTGRTYEGPAHKYFSFQGQYLNGRPEIRISTQNNNSSEHINGDEPLWSGATEPIQPSTASSVGVMLAHPWMFQVAAEELTRDHGTQANEQQSNERNYVYFSGIASQAQRDALTSATLTLDLKDGKTTQVTFKQPPHDNDGGEAAPLPAGVSSDDVVGVEGAPSGTQLFVLGSNFKPRQLT